MTVAPPAVPTDPLTDALAPLRLPEDLRLSPDLVLELASVSDEGPRGLSALRRKMASYQANVALLGWLLIPDQQAVEVWPASGAGEPQCIEEASSLDAGPLLAYSIAAAARLEPRRI